MIFNFWTDEKLLGTRLDLLVKTARSNLLPVRDRIIFFKDGGVLARRTGNVYSRTHEGTCQLHRDLGEPVDVPDR